MSEPLDFTDMDWTPFLEATADLEPTGFHEFAMSHVGTDGADRHAIDLGFGGGRDTRLMLSRGWNVFALDVTPEAETILLERVDPDHRDRLEIAIGRFEEVPLPSTDLVFASYSLPFAASALDAAMAAAVASVRTGGWFTGVLFGENDDWISDEVAAVTREWIADKLADFDPVHIEETDADAEFGTDGETKHWHWYFVAAQRPA